METANDQEASPEAASFASFLGQLLGYLRPHWLLAAIIAPTLLLQTAFRVLLPIGYQQIFDRAIAERDVEYLTRILTLLLIAWLVQAVAALVQEQLAARLGARAMNDLRRDMFAHLQRLQTSFYSRVDTGDLLSRFTSDSAAIENTLVRGVPMFLYGCLILTISAGLLFFMEWRLALVTFAVLPVALIGPRLLSGRAQQASYDRKNVEARVTTTVQENVGAHTVVRLFELAASRSKIFSRQLEALRKRVVRSHFLAAVVGRAANQSIFLVQIVVVGVGAYLAVWGLLTVGALVGFVTLLINVANSANFLSGILPSFLQASGSMRRIRELLDETPEILDPPGAVTLPRLADSLSFENVSFGYGSAPPTLHDVSFRIAAGESVAIVGPSGCGKSTILNLILRLWDPDSGSVRLDGVDLREASESSLRAQTGVVLQETVLFNLSLKENIRLGNTRLSQEEVVRAARQAEIHTMIQGFPEGYETVVGERGGNLSGGQRQRIAIARAILRDPALLVLDEATSALDAATEATLTATLNNLARDRTVIATTHRLGTVVEMDRILVVDQGRVVEQGAHQELLDLGGVYSDLWHKQSGFTLSADGRRAECSPERLRSIPLLSRIDDARLATLARSLVSESYPAGRIVFESGDDGDKLYLIARGAVEVTLQDASTSARRPKMQDGDYFGELALLDDAPRSGSVRTVAPTVFLTLARRPFEELLADEPELRSAIEHEARLRRGAQDDSLATIAIKV